MAEHNNETKEQLRQETEKWLEKIEKELPNIKPSNAKGNDMLRNINAYVSDAKHFLKTNDFVRAFEAVVWAWSWLEIGLELEKLEKV